MISRTKSRRGGPRRFRQLASEDSQALLKDWMRLNADITSLPRQALMELIEWEMAGARRLSFLLRVHSRFNRLRAVEERHLLSQGKLPWQKL